MPLDRRVRRLVKLMNTLERRRPGGGNLIRRRESSARIARLKHLAMPAGPAPASQVEHMVPVEGGAIRVRLYTPHGSGPFPLYVFIHGGGWAIGTLDERDPRCRAIAAGARCVVASVDYRLAPECAYPTGVEDCYAALGWLVDHASEVGIDATRIGIGGESAGGNLAAATCLVARDRGGPTITHQWLDVPALDLTLSQPSFRDVPDGLLLDREEILLYRQAYLVDIDRADEPYASPLCADDLTGLPSAWIMSAEYDKLRDDGRVYADRLKEAGVDVTYRQLDGHVHPSFAMTRLIPTSAAYERDAIRALAAALHP